MSSRPRGELIGARVREIRPPAQHFKQALAELRGLDFVAPGVAFVSASIALWFAAAVQGVPFFASQSWIRADSGFYLGIASDGYQLMPCTIAPFTRHDWCGNSGWFPGYPGALAPLFDLGLPQNATAVVVAWLFGLAVLVLLWNGFLRQLTAPTRFIALAFAAFAPGTIFTRAVFPMAMTAFFLVLCLWLLQRRQLWWAGAAGAVAASAYPTAVLVAPIAALWAFNVGRELPLPRRMANAVVSGGLVAFGFVAALGVQWLQTGTWTAYFKTQAKYHHGLHEPLALLWPNIHDVIDGAHGPSALPALEATVVSGMMLVLLAGTLFLRIKRRASSFELLIAIYVLVFWLVPYTQADVSYYRGDSLLMPAALLIPKLPAGVSALLLSAAVPLLVFIAFGFFQNVLA